MTRYFVAAAAFLALFAVAAQEAAALTSKTRICISRERRAYRDALRTARSSELATFQQKYRSCFGPGADCAQLCQTGQILCQAPYRAASQKCIEDDDAQGKDDPNFTSCGDRFDAAIAVCNGEADTAAALKCAADARLNRFKCNQACAVEQQPGLDACNFEFSDCIQSCASAR